jgi:hypothetical protein
MTQLSKLAIGAIAVALVAAGAGIGYGIGHQDDESGSAAGRTRATVLGNRFEASTTSSTSAPSTTSTTAAVQAGTPGAQPSTPTTSLTPTVTVARTTATTTTPATSPPATTAGGTCGNGSANAVASAQIFPVEPRPGTQYQTDVAVEVRSNMDRAIELDRIVISIDYNNGKPSETHALPVAGTVMQPGERRVFTASYRTPTPPSGVSLVDFAWHTAGQPQCVGRPA